MARNFDGSNDNISFGSDTSIDDWVALSCGAWIILNSRGTDQLWYKRGSNGWEFRLQFATPNHNLRLGRDFATTDLLTVTDTNPLAATGVRYHVMITHDGTASGGTGSCKHYFNGVEQTFTLTTSPSGALVADNASTLFMGETSSGTNDLDAKVMCAIAANEVLDAAAVNRAMWWGRPHGGIEVYHPFYTSKLTNEGTATADGTASGTTVQAFAAPTVRPGFACMGIGVGF